MVYNQGMRNLQHINTFLLLAELGQFNKVAKQLNLSVTAVSKQIRNFEDQLGEDLFIRTTRRVILTDFGQSLYQHCQGLNGKLRELDEFIATKRETPRGNLMISCSLHTGKQILLDNIQEFCALYPDINLKVNFNEMIDSHDQDNADIHFAYAAHHTSHQDMRYKKVFSLQHVLVAAPSYLKKYGKVETIADLQQHKFINLSLRHPIDEIKQSKSKNIKIPYPYIIANNYEALNQLCLNGAGIMLSANFQTKTHIETGDLIQLLPNLDYLHFDICIFYRAMKYEIPKVRVFIDFFTCKIRESLNPS